MNPKVVNFLVVDEKLCLMTFVFVSIKKSGSDKYV